MTTILNGLLGGLLVGFVAAVVTQAVAGTPSATAGALEQLFGDTGKRSRWWEVTVQVIYGGLAGAGLLIIELHALQRIAIPPSTGEALGIPIIWSMLLLLVLTIIWKSIDSLALDRSSLLELLTYHLVYGVCFGVWIRMTWIT